MMDQQKEEGIKGLMISERLKNRYTARGLRAVSKNGSDKIDSVAVAVGDGFRREISVTQCSKVMPVMGGFCPCSVNSPREW